MSDPLEQIRLRDLILLEHVHTLGTLRLAAQAMHVTQPAITQILKGLEAAFGVSLVDRGRRGVSLNVAGLAALERLRCARHELERAREAALTSRQPMLRLGATPIATLQHLPLAVRQMRSRLPGVRLTLSESGVDSLWRQLSEGTLDALVGRLPGSNPQYLQANGLRYETIGSERMVLVASRDHPVAKERARPKSRLLWLEALAASQWVLPPADALAVLNFNEWFGEAGLTPPVPAVVSGSFYATLNIVAKTDMLAVVPESAALGLLATLKLKILDTPWRNPPVNLVFAARESSWDGAGISALRACFAGTTPA
jgi:DNA-binding transcriptional LysR family regulator